MLQTMKDFLNERLRQLRWRLTLSYALVALATVLMVEWWGLVGASLFLSGNLEVLELIQVVVRIALEIVLPTALLLIIPTALVGALFGQISARWLDIRLGSLEEATRSWQTGDFSRQIHDTTGDEISELAGRLNEMAVQLQELMQTRQELAALEERNHLARELHNSAKQAGLAAIMQIGAARARLESDPISAAAHLAEADELVHQVQQELTGLIWELRPVGLSGQDLPAALKTAIERWSRQTNIPANLSVDLASALPAAVEEALFRILQESLANVARHSQAGQVEIALSLKNDQASLVVHDDGVGFDPAQIQPTELGLRSMRERADALGGSLSVESAPGQGTYITVLLPLSSLKKREVS